MRRATATLSVPREACARSWRPFALAAAALLACGAIGCGDDRAKSGQLMPDVRPAAARIRTSALQAGPGTVMPEAPNPYAADGAALAEGRGLYLGMNCHGCHGSAGGGGIGPPLADADWIYGGADANIYQAIMQGRPNGMPTYGARLPEESAWKIAAFVRTLTDSTTAAASR